MTQAVYLEKFSAAGSAKERGALTQAYIQQIVDELNDLSRKYGGITHAVLLVTIENFAESLRQTADADDIRAADALRRNCVAITVPSVGEGTTGHD